MKKFYTVYRLSREGSDPTCLRTARKQVTSRMRQWTIAGAAAAVLAGCAGQPQQLSMQQPSGQSQTITFPNGMIFGGASGSQSSSLAQIMVEANNNNMQD